MKTKTTNISAKRAFTKSLYKLHINMYDFISIYCDEYWNYCIDLYGLTDVWNEFFELYKKEFDNKYVPFREEYDYILNKVVNFLNSKDLNILTDYAQKIKGSIPIKQIYVYDLPEGDYLRIDLHNAGMQSLHRCGLIDDNEILDIISNNSDSYIIQHSKNLILQAYSKTLNYDMNQNLYEVMLELLYDIVKSDNPTILEINNEYDIVGYNGDALYLKSKSDIDENKFKGDYNINGISFNIDVFSKRDCDINGYKIVYDDNKKMQSYRTGTIRFAPWIYNLIIYKLIHNQTPNEFDLSIGCEDEIYYTLSIEDFKIL